MSLTPGTRLGPYTITTPLGAGGMGEVYKAIDTRLDRTVAIKVLPSHVASDPGLKLRFEREGKAISSLNHAHICTLYDVGNQDGIDFLVMEYLDGETLAQRLTKGGLPLEQALRYAAEIADALDAAHEKGIVHRDLKPANIKITPDGTVKVLDFGLAKAAALASGDLTNSPTVPATGTRDGVILGTIPYMSPEQARGLTVDKRTDIWAFGCVLYEMLAGRSAFARATVSDSIAAILEREPDWTALPAAVPEGVRRLLRHCLEKDLKRRLRDIADARLDLDTAISAPASPARPRVSVPVSLASILACGLVAAGGLAGWWFAAPSEPPAAGDARLQRITDSVGMEESPALSPDGRTVAFVALVGGRRQISVQLLAGGSPLQITKDDADHRQPRWAPDSNALLYHTPGKSPGEEGTVWEIAALGGVARPIARALGGGDVSPDGRRVLLFQYRERGVALVAVAREGSGTETLGELDGESLYRYPRWSPDGRWVAFERIIISEFDSRTYVLPSAGGDPVEVARAALLNGLAWLPDSSGIVYASALGSTVLYPPTYNLRVVRRDGTGDRQLTFGDTTYVEPDAHRSGALLVSRIRSESDVWRFATEGSTRANTDTALRITRQTSAAQTPSVSPDGTEVVYLSDSGGHGNLWVAKTDGSGSRQLTFERDEAVSIGVPVWSSSGSEIAFIVTRAGVSGQWLINRDGSGLRQFVSRGAWSSWSPDGQWLYYSALRDKDTCIEKAPLDGGPPVSVRCDNAFAPALAPDGATLYYATPLTRGTADWDWEIRKAEPEGGKPRALARIASARIPIAAMLIPTIPSPDGQWLALPLSENVTSNLWALSSEDGSMRRLTDFGDRPVVIARRVSWSPDGQYIYAAVAEVDADVVILEGLLP